MATATQTKVKDPVCGMEIEPSQAASRRDFDGATYYFCSADCRAKFDAEPTRYATGAAPSSEETPLEKTGDVSANGTATDLSVAVASKGASANDASANGVSVDNAAANSAPANGVSANVAGCERCCCERRFR